MREAVLESAARLFAKHGVSHVSLRDIAREAEVQLPLIYRYVGHRAELIDAVFERLNGRVAEYAEVNPLQPFEYGRDSILGRWIAMVTHYASQGTLPPPGDPNPLLALAAVFEDSFGMDPGAAKLRSAQVTALSIGWRMYEDYLIATVGLDDVGLDALRAEINSVQRLIASTPLPTQPPDPSGSD